MLGKADLVQTLGPVTLQSAETPQRRIPSGVMPRTWSALREVRNGSPTDTDIPAGNGAWRGKPKRARFSRGRECAPVFGAGLEGLWDQDGTLTGGYRNTVFDSDLEAACGRNRGGSQRSEMRGRENHLCPLGHLPSEASLHLQPPAATFSAVLRNRSSPGDPGGSVR